MGNPVKAFDFSHDTYGDVVADGLFPGDMLVSARTEPRPKKTYTHGTVYSVTKTSNDTCTFAAMWMPNDGSAPKFEQCEIHMGYRRPDGTVRLVGFKTYFWKHVPGPRKSPDSQAQKPVGETT